MQLRRVVADDLTGACDVGGELLGLGRTVVVRSAAGSPAWPAGAVVEVHNTQSRGVDAAEAGRRVAAAYGSVPLAPDELALKKIDTALRGHVAAELHAAVGALQPRLVLVAAAIPEAGRTTEGGVQRVDGTPVAESAFAHDPLTPVRESDLLAMIRAVGLRTAHAPLPVVRDEGRYAALLEALRSQPGTVIVADAVTQDDLDRSVRAASADGGALLVLGSIGVARAVAHVLGAGDAAVAGSVAASVAAPGSAKPADRVVVVVGSAHPAARTQLRAMTVRHGVLPCEVAVDAADAAADLVASLVEASGLGVLVPRPGGSPALLVRSLAAAAGALLRRLRPDGLILIGGETAYHCLDVLGGPPLRIEARPWPLVVAARVAEGPLAGMRVLCKGGSAGGDETLNEMIALVQEGRGA